MRLRVKRENGEEFEKEIEDNIYKVRIEDFEEGKKIKVRIDNNERKVVLKKNVKQELKIMIED